MATLLFADSFQALIQYPDTVSAQTAKTVSTKNFVFI